MKYKILSCLLAASAMFSVQAFKVLNNTKQNITVSRFGYIRSGIPALTSNSPRVVQPDHIIDTNSWTDLPFDFMTATVNQHDYPFDKLTPNTIITFEENEQGISFRVEKIIENNEQEYPFNNLTLDAMFVFKEDKHGNIRYTIIEKVSDEI